MTQTEKNAIGVMLYLSWVGQGEGWIWYFQSFVLLFCMSKLVKL